MTSVDVVMSVSLGIVIVRTEVTGRKRDSHTRILLTVSNTFTDTNADPMFLENVGEIRRLSHPRERLGGIDLELVGIDRGTEDRFSVHEFEKIEFEAISAFLTNGKIGKGKDS